MLTFLRNLLFDESAFVRFARAGGVAAGGLAASGAFPELIGAHPVAGSILMGLSVLMSGSQTRTAAQEGR